MSANFFPFSAKRLLGEAAVYADLLHKARPRKIETFRVFPDRRQKSTMCPPAETPGDLCVFWDPDDRGVQRNLMSTNFFRFCIFGQIWGFVLESKAVTP